MILRRLEPLVFVVLAVALHLIFFVQMPEKGSQASGVGGDEFVTLIGATEQIETMVADWQRPPEVVAETTQQAPAPVEFEPPPAPAIDLVALPELTRPEDLTPPEPDTAMVAPEAPPPPPPQQPDLPDTRPEPRPAPQKPAQPAETAQQSSRGQVEQKAAGAGGGAQAGAGRKSVSTGVSKQQEASMLQVWGAKIRSRIERAKRYPAGRARGGQVGVSLRVSRDGQLMGVSVYRSSGNPAFDQAAIQSVQRARRFPKAPQGLTDASYQFSVMITFQ